MHDSGASTSHQPQALMSSAWKTTNTRDDSQSRQPVTNVPIPDDVHFSDTEDTDDAHLLKIKPRPDWLKPVLDEERPETPEPN
nr:hypothetical protein [Tanacetum cinerariifolium]GFB23627.1 hypothetical protein [Tanacetum cinerariifolium]